MSNNKNTLIGTTISKVEAEIAGFDYEVYEYEAKMVAVIPGTLIVDSTFRIISGMAIALNDDETHYLIIKIGDNKGIAFEQLNPAIRVATKAKVFGETFSVKELVQALKNPIFKEDAAPVNIHTKDHSDGLTVIYKCAHCNKLHLLAGHLGDVPGQATFDTSDSEKVYINKSDYEALGFINKKELLDVLVTLPEEMKVLIETIWAPETFTLTNVYKCSEKCPSIHLDSAYDDSHHSLN
jgi:hypothetical protein